jgi:hypothetical protein
MKGGLVTGFNFDLALTGPPPVAGRPLSEVLTAFADQVRSTVAEIEPLL